MIHRFILSLFIVLAAGCSQSINLDQPPEIRLGEDVCDACGMIISEARFAAAYYTDTGEVRQFDDIGDMCRYQLQNGENVARFWVHDYDTEEWIQAENAVFVRGDGLYTPMASGIVAFSNPDRASEFAGGANGQTMSFDRLMDMVESGEAGSGHPSMPD